MIAEIRKHINTCVKSVSKNFKTGLDPYLRDEEVIETKVPYWYSTTFLSTVNEIVDTNGTVSNVTVTLKTYVQGHRDKLADFDEGYCRAIMIDCLIVDRTKYSGSQYIKNIQSAGVNPIEVLDSQDIYAFESTFTIKLSYGLGD
tara:strand:- start:5462 stop:5893 length:432 start_codon:yes stop_codon:yes gene_type:complete